jgi:ribosome-associated protein
MTESISGTSEEKRNEATSELVKACCRALDGRKAEDIKILYLGSKSTIADYFVIATGTSAPHLRALRIALEKELDSRKTSILGMDSSGECGWLVLDADSIIFHLFTKPMRERYALEKLWKDADMSTFEPDPVAAMA